MEKECVQFCDGCPMIPPGVRAELTEVEPLKAELHRYYFAKVSPDHKKYFMDQARLHARVTKSSNGDVSVGDTAAIIVNTNGGGYKEASDLIAGCNGKISTNLLQRLLRIRTRCGAFDSRLTV